MIRLFKLLVIIIALFVILTSGFSIQCGSESLNPTHNKDLKTEIVVDSQYWNSWTNPIKLKQKAKELALLSNEYHDYVLNEYDCNDMAVDIWNMLSVGGKDWDPIISIIVVGNFDLEKETFADCNHAWLIILNQQPDGYVNIYALEPTNGEMYRHTGQTIDKDPNAKYFEGFFYDKPSGLRADLGDRW